MTLIPAISSGPIFATSSTTGTSVYDSASTAGSSVRSPEAAVYPRTAAYSAAIAATPLP